MKAFGAHLLDEIKQVEAFWSLLDTILRVYREARHFKHEYDHLRHQVIRYWHLFLQFLARVFHRCRVLLREAIGM